MNLHENASRHISHTVQQIRVAINLHNKVISGGTYLNLLAEERVCGLHIPNSVAIEQS